MTQSFAAERHADCEIPIARNIAQLSISRWGARKGVYIVGRDERLVMLLERLAKFATADAPVLLTGETGTGKELFARALYLLSGRRHKPFLGINCAQYHDGQLLSSELFGHKRGSFTGAVTDHAGVFEEGDGGVVFLDEVGELSVPAQAMLLRALSEGEIMPVGATHAHPVDVRVIAATSRDLKPMIANGQFRPDLYYRLRNFHLHVPPLRDRGDDWELIANFYLERLADARSMTKRLSPSSRDLLREYHWPGNVREVKSIVDLGYHLSGGSSIEPDHFAEELESTARREQLRSLVPAADFESVLARMREGGESFWEAVYRPYLAREMSRADVRRIIDGGLARTRGSYKRLTQLFGVAESDYLKFMDFLRHQKLKPNT